MWNLRAFPTMQEGVRPLRFVPSSTGLPSKRCPSIGFLSRATKVCIVKAMVFPVVMYGCESWTIKKPECRGIDAQIDVQRTVVLEKTLESPLDCKEIQPVHSEGDQP